MDEKKTEKKSRYSPLMQAIHELDRMMDKLPVDLQMQVYLYMRNQFQPELSFLVPSKFTETPR